MSSREEILGDVRANLCAGGAGGTPVAPPDVPLLGSYELDPPARVREFRERLESVGGVVYAAFDPARAGQALLGIVRRLHAHRVAFTDAPELAPLRAVLSEFREVELIEPDAGVDELLDCEVGVTAAQWGIAESGTLVLESRVERHRLRSLLPAVHVAVLPVSRVLATMGEVLKTLGRPLDPCVTLVTGPSRTADIELQLVIGVHGPRELHVVLI